MARSRGQEGTPDRLAAVLEELEAVRRAPGWVPSEHTVVDEPRSKVAELPRRVAETRRARHAAGSGSDGDEVRPREPLLRPPEPLIGAQVAPSRLAVIGALILVTVAALVFGGRVLWARASARPHPVTSTGASMVSTGRAGSPSAATAAGSTASAAAAQPGFGAASQTPSATPTTVVVQVVGQVHKPGVVHVRTGSRVQDVVSAAGGALSSADLSAINLARVVSDGEQIQVPKPGEQLTPAPQATPSATAGGSGSGTSTGVVDLNTADQAALEGLPGVGPVMAQRILQWRADNGRFSAVDELGEVSGIGDKTLEQLRPLVTVG